MITPLKKYLLPAITLLSAILIFGFTKFAFAAYEVEVGLPNVPKGTVISSPAQYINYLFVFGLSLIGFIAVGVIVVGGVMYMLGAGNPGKTGKAKEIIVAALSGIVLLLCAYLILATIDPSLTDLTPPDLKQYNIKK